MKKKLLIGCSVFVALIGIYAGVKLYASFIAGKRVNDAIAEVSDFVQITYEDVDVDLIGFDFILTGVHFSPLGTEETVKAEKIIVKSLDHKSDIPSFLNVSVEGIEIRQLKKNTPVMRELGYDSSLLVDLDINYHYDKQNKALEMKTISINATGAGRLATRFRLGRIDLQAKNLFAILLAYPYITVYRAAVVYKDDSLTDRLMRSAAKNENTDVGGYRNQVIGKIDQEIQDEKSHFNRTALNALKGFIEDPGEISISATPDRPQLLRSIIEVDHPRELIPMLNLIIESKP